MHPDTHADIRAKAAGRTREGALLPAADQIKALKRQAKRERKHAAKIAAANAERLRRRAVAWTALEEQAAGGNMEAVRLLLDLTKGACV